MLFTIGFSAEKWGFVKCKYSTVTAFTKKCPRYQTLWSLLTRERRKFNLTKKSPNNMTFLIKKRNTFTQLGFPKVKMSAVFYFLAITKQTQIERLGTLWLWWNRGRRDAVTHCEEPGPGERLLLGQHWGNWFSVEEGPRAQTAAQPLAIPQPPVLGLGVRFGQASSRRWAGDCVVGWNDSGSTRKGGEGLRLTLSL